MAQGPGWVPHLLHLPGTRPTARRPPGNHPHVYPGPESVQNATGTRGTPLYAQTGIHVHLVHHLSVPGRLGVYEVVGDGWQLNVINTHVPFGEATEPFLQALAEAYRQMAMLAPTVIIGDMNAAPTPARPRRTGHTPGPSSPRHHRNAGARGPDQPASKANHPTSPTKRMPPHPASTYAMATPPPSSERRPDMGPSRWDPQAIAPCTSASPSPTFPPAPQKMRTKAYHPPEDAPAA